jgi:hypothetical protein
MTRFEFEFKLAIPAFASTSSVQDQLEKPQSFIPVDFYRQLPEVIP